MDTEYVYACVYPVCKSSARVSHPESGSGRAILLPPLGQWSPRDHLKGTDMSQYGSPPDPNQPPEGQPESGPAGAGGAEPQQPYNPYPQQWSGETAPGSSPYDPANPSGPQNPYSQQTPHHQQSPYTPQDPYAAPAPYGQQPAAPGAPANPYGGGSARADRPTFGFGGYAGWFTRVGAYLIDQICGNLAAAPLWIGYIVLLSNTHTTQHFDGTTTSSYDGSIGVPVTLIIVGALTALAFFIWNICIRQGRTGASIGKSVLAIRLVNSDLQPIGAGWSFLRYVLHILDGICYIGYLWPIWDSRKQTFADKIMNTFVIQATTPEPRPF
jgi:uncharacterized RDD family membrane protein YckC